MSDNSQAFFTPEQVASQLRVSTSTVHRWLRDGKLKGRRISGRWRVSEKDLDKYLGKLTVTVTSGRLNYGVAPNGEILWFEVK